ncbi:polyketide cyclase/dehydrase and lipid transportsuperfamily protein [Striga asiatica]|uniref:Polyketide cyclase/dehydrase and lipid transportsuperfamily protein n=1 Tax=Striga asiatica TaxID=4170 RepID=A0A5A7QVP0_STRAF|nr:polyketide cyclase/dehydrase and lipid transportsuperfamily protein [Striga asiatica]
MQEMLNEAAEAYAVPINRAVWISKIFTFIPQSATSRAHRHQSRPTIKFNLKNITKTHSYEETFEDQIPNHGSNLNAMREDPKTSTLSLTIIKTQMPFSCGGQRDVPAVEDKEGQMGNKEDDEALENLEIEEMKMYLKHFELKAQKAQLFLQMMIKSRGH